MHIDQVIRERRLALGLTQEELADKIGVSAPAVSKWEKGCHILTLPCCQRWLAF